MVYINDNVSSLLKEVFVNENRIEEWLNSPNISLNNKKPIQLLKNGQDRKVEMLLISIIHNLPY